MLNKLTVPYLLELPCYSDTLDLQSNPSNIICDMMLIKAVCSVLYHRSELYTQYNTRYIISFTLIPISNHSN